MDLISQLISGCWKWVCLAVMKPNVCQLSWWNLLVWQAGAREVSHECHVGREMRDGHWYIVLEKGVVRLQATHLMLGGAAL